MNKSYLLFKHEFLCTIKKVGFIILTFSVPTLALLGIGAYKLATNVSKPKTDEIKTIGYVDEVGIFNEHTEQGTIKLIPFESRKDAKKALIKKDIAEYFIIPSDYTSTGIIRRYTLEKELTTPALTVIIIKSFVTGNLLKDKVPPNMVALISSPLNLKVTRVAEEGGKELKQSNAGNIIIPAVFSLLLSFALLFGATSLITGLGEEKESHLIEVLFSSVSVRQLLISKVLALGVAGLLQVLVWLISAPLLLDLASSTFGGFLSDIEIPANFIILGIVYFILGYLLFAVLSITVGAISPGVREGNQIAGFYTLWLFVPLWFSGLLINFPNSYIWVVLTIFPVTAPVQTMLRLAVSDIPLWQIMTSIGVLVLSIIVGLFLSIRIFRAYMLMYGKRPGLREIIHSLRQG